MQLTSSELSKAVNSVNKEAYFLKNDKKVLVLDIPAGELKFAIDLSRLSPFLLEYLCYYPDENDRYKNIEYDNLYKYGSYRFIGIAFEKSDYQIDSLMTYIINQSAELTAWLEKPGSDDRLVAYIDASWMDTIMSGYMAFERTDLEYNEWEYIFYTLRDAASKASGIDLSDIEPPQNP